MRNVKRQQPRKLPPKKKPYRDWCPGGGAQLRELTDRAFDYIARFTVPIKEDEEVTGMLQKRWKARCSLCNRRFRPKKILYTSQREFFFYVMPSHKTS